MGLFPGVTMNDLFRFLLMRPADVTAPDDVKTLNASFVNQGATRPIAQRLARAFIDNNPPQRLAEGLAYAATARAVVEAVGAGSMKAKDLADIVKKVTGKTLAAVLDPKFAADEVGLADSLVAMKLLSDSSGGDAPGLAKLAQGYD